MLLGALAVAQLEQKTVTPGEGAERVRRRGGKLGKAGAAADVLAALGVKGRLRETR